MYIAKHKTEIVSNKTSYTQIKHDTTKTHTQNKTRHNTTTNKHKQHKTIKRTHKYTNDQRRTTKQ